MHLVNENDPYLLGAKTFERKYKQVADTLIQAANTSAVSLSEVLPPMGDKDTNNSGAASLKVIYNFDFLHFWSNIFYGCKLRRFKWILSPI